MNRLLTPDQVFDHKDSFDCVCAYITPIVLAVIVCLSKDNRTMLLYIGYLPEYICY